MVSTHLHSLTLIGSIHKSIGQALTKEENRQGHAQPSRQPEPTMSCMRPRVHLPRARDRVLLSLVFTKRGGRNHILSTAMQPYRILTATCLFGRRTKRGLRSKRELRVWILPSFSIFQSRARRHLQVAKDPINLLVRLPHSTDTVVATGIFQATVNFI